MAKPRRSGGKSAPYDHTQTTEEELLGPDEAAPIVIRETGKFLTPAAVESMKAQVREGVPIPVAATAVGAGSRAKHWAVMARRHREEGIEAGWEPGQSPELFWLEAMETARAQYESTATMALNRAGLTGEGGDWRALAWALERRASKRWHVQHKLLLEAKNGEKVEIATYATEKLIAIARGLLPEEDVKLSTRALPADIIDAEIED